MEYQQSKKDFLQKLLGEHCTNIDWIWVGSGSRRRATYQINRKNHLGFFTEKTHDLVEIDQDESVEEKISALISPLKTFLKKQEENFYTQVVVTLFDNGLDIVFVVKRAPNIAQIQQLISFAKEHDLNISYREKDTPTAVFLTRRNQIFFNDFRVDLDSDVFLQATKSGLDGIIKIIRSTITKQCRAVDIYAGFGAYSFAIYDLMKSVSAFEGSQKMIDSLNKNAVANGISNKIKGFTRDIFSSPITARELKDFDFVIINPPRNGASPQVLEIAKSPIKKLVYVSCNPQSFKRDAEILIDRGFKIKKLTAIDQFYATKHLELVAVIEK